MFLNKQDHNHCNVYLMKYTGFLLCLFLLSSCLSDEEKRLQTDQSFEGEEIFRIAFSLDEHVSYAFQSFDFYQDTLNHSAISGCPMISINEFPKEITLTFGEGECASNKALRSGKIKLAYLDSLEENTRISIGYDNYWVKGVKLEGKRILDLIEIDSTATKLTLLDSVADFIVTDANRSTSKMNGVFTHEIVVANDSIQYFTTIGSGSGRNLAGRHFEMEITQAKRFSGNCLRTGFQLAESGQERWIFERTVEANAIHTVNFQQAEDCNHNARVLLYNGNEMLKQQ